MINHQHASKTADGKHRLKQGDVKVDLEGGTFGFTYTGNIKMGMAETFLKKLFVRLSKLQQRYLQFLTHNAGETGKTTHISSQI